MAHEKYNLTWHTYTDHLKLMLQNLMKDEDSHDVTLVCDDKVKIKAHKFVLRSCSPVFENILENTNNEPIIYLKDIKHQEMESILQFMYLGEASFYQERMKEFLNVAKNLEVKKLCKDVEVDQENMFTDQTSDDDELQEDLDDLHSSNSANQGIEQDV